MGVAIRRLVLLVGLPLILSCLLGFSATAQAESVKWVWPTSSGTCWQGGCASVGEGYVLSHGLNNGEAGSGNVFCGYHNLQGNSTRMTKEESGNAGSWTGFTPPSPVQKYQLGDGLGDICQGWGSQWGYQVNGCANAWCGMGQLVTGIPEMKPWSSSYGQPKVVVSGWIDANKAQSAGAPASGWGYICPYFAGPSNVVLEYCIKAFTLELNGGGDIWPAGSVTCGVGAPNLANVIAEFNGTGAFATNLGPGVTKPWTGASTGWVNFNASISGSQLEAVIKTILNERGAGQACANWPNLSTNPAEYTLQGIASGYEFHGSNTVVGVTTNNLAISTEYTSQPPVATTSAPSEIQHHQATLNGNVETSGLDTHYYFQYGETTGYVSSTTSVDAGSGGPVSATISGLEAGTTYHYRLVASNSAGESYGSDQVFTTQAPTWSVQSVVPPPSAMHVNGISCTSSSACTAVGSYTNTSGIVLTLVERWNGTAWVVQPTANIEGEPSNQLTGVSCASATSCFASGNYTTSGGAVGSYTESWNGTTWSKQGIATPSGGASASWLSGVSCTSATACTIAGDYTNTSGVVLTLVERWNGSVWAVQSSPNTEGVPNNQLTGVSCTSATSCFASANYTVSSGGVGSYTESWNGTTWSKQGIATPSGGASASWLTGVSCTSSTACTIAGDYTNTSGVVLTLVERWNGSVWVVQSSPNIEGVPSNQLTGVSCASATSCFASGNYTTSGGATGSYTDSWNGTTWSKQSVAAVPGASTSWLTGVSCTSATACTIAGTYTNSSGALMMAESWNGSAWSVQPTPTVRVSLRGVSCTSSTSCTAVGSYKGGAGIPLALAERWNGVEWSVQTTSNPGGPTEWSATGVSCVGTSFCMASDDDLNGVHGIYAELWTGSSWAAVGMPLPSGAKEAWLNGISCTASSACTAVGSYKSSTGTILALAEHWNGLEWSVQTTSNPGGPTEWSATGVSCVGTSFCMASDDDLLSGQHRIYAELWTGSSWAGVGMPLPSGATEAWLSGISCTATSACTAVGSYKSSTGTILTLAEHWNGVEWSVQTTSNPGGPTEWSMTGVSCVGTSFCMASDDDLLSGQHRIYAELWTGSSWAGVGTPLPTGATEVWLNGFSCTTRTECTAIGGYEGTGVGLLPFAERFS